jgi:hypothetical protein
MVVVLVKEVQLVVAMDDCILVLEMLCLKQRRSIGMAPLIELQIETWKI